MKRSLFKLFNLLMTCVVLVSSMGFGLVERSCHMRGKTVYLNLKEAEAKRCASDQQVITEASDKVILSRTPCCQDETTYENVDVTSSLTQLVAKFIKTIAHTIIVSVVSVLTWLIGALSSADSSATLTVSDPPLPAGRTLLALLQRLLI